MNQKSELIHIYAKLPKVKKPSFIGSISEPDYKLIRNRIIGHGEGGLKSLVNTLLVKGGWDAKRDERNIFSPVIETFMQTPNIWLKPFVHFTENKDTYHFFSKYLQQHKVFNLYSMFEKELKDIYPYEQIVTLVDQLWSISTCINSVGVGPGEICLTLLTDAKKGTKGDLIITNVGGVEVKSSRGRIGSDMNALNFPKRIEKEFKAKVNHKETWNNNIQNFFYSNYKLPLAKLSKAFALLGTQILKLEQEKELAKGISYIITKYNICEALKNKDRKTLAQLVLAIQLASYQSEHKFLYLLAVNKQTKDAYPFYFQNSLEKNVIHIYDQIVKVNRFNIELDIDHNGTRKGIALSLK